MKVLVISPWYPTSEKPNNGIFIKEQTTALFEKGIHTSVIFYNGNLGFNPFNLISKGNMDDLEIQSNKFATFYKNGLHFPLKVALTRRFWIKQYLKLFRKYVVEFGKPDVIHAHTYWGGMIALEIKKKYSIPYLITEHSSSLVSNIKKKDINKKNIITRVYKDSSMLIAVGTTLRKAMRSYTLKKIEIIPNFINTSFFKPENEKSLNKHQTITIVGGLIDRKQIHLAILSINLLFNKGYNISLNIVGGGRLYEELNTFIKELNAEGYIKLLGQKNRQEVKEVLDKSDIYLHTSKFETFGIVLIEAMAMGLPVVSTRSGGPEDFITKDVGILVDQDNFQNIANAIEEMIKNKNRYDSKKIRKYVIDNYSDEVISRKTINIYNNILNK